MMKPELRNWNKSGKPIHQRTLKDLNPIIFHIKIYDKYDTNIGMLEMDDLDLWYFLWHCIMITYYDEIYDDILWWNIMKFYDLNLCDDGWWWNDVGWWCMKLCGLILCWYCDEMIWTVVKMNCGKWWNDGGGWYDLRCVCV